MRVSSEQRYQDIKKEWYFHETSYLDQTKENGQYKDVVKDYGCGHESNRGNQNICVPECRYYAKEGRIEDEEVIAKHNEWVESYRQRNAIVEPSTLFAMLTESEQKQPYFQAYYDERDVP